MELKFSKGFSIILTVIILLTYFFGVPIISKVYDLFNPESAHHISMIDLIIGDLHFSFSKLGLVIIGLWLFLNAVKFNLDKWTWLLVGLIFGQYGLILLGLILIYQNIESGIDLFKSLQPILILLIISVFLNSIITPLLGPYRVINIDNETLILIMDYNRYLRPVFYCLIIFMNICLAIKLRSWIKTLNMTNKSVWIVSTVFLGLFPVVLFNTLIMIRKEDKITS